MDRMLLVQNFLKQSYHALRDNDRFMQDGNSKSYFESFWDNVNNAFSMGVKGYRPPNSTVESFYRGTLDAEEFCIQVRETIIDKNLEKLDTNLDPLLSLSWDTYSSVPSHKRLCGKFPKLCSRQLWGIFNKLDIESSCFVCIDDIILVIMKLYKANGKEESASNIREWFCDQKSIDFWLFFSALVEFHSDLLSPPVLLSIYEEIFFEILKEGKMKKKGHKVANWKERWFVLSSSHLYYYESQENRSLKGTVTINKNSKVEKLNSTKEHSYLFRVTDGKSGIPYDISTRDPQMLNDWMEIVQVVIAAQSEGFASTIQRLQRARERLFPNTVLGFLPPYKPTGAAEYNEGVYRMVPPSAKRELKSPTNTNSDIVSPEKEPPLQRDSVLEQKRAPLTTQPSLEQRGPSVSPPPTDPTYQVVDKVRGPQIKPYKHSDTLQLVTYPSSEPSQHTYVNLSSTGEPLGGTDQYNPDIDGNSLSPSPPPVSIRQSFDSTGHSEKFIAVNHGSDHMLINKVQSSDEELPSKSQKRISLPSPPSEASTSPTSSTIQTYQPVEKVQGPKVKPYKRNSSSDLYLDFSQSDSHTYMNIGRPSDPMSTMDQHNPDNDQRFRSLSPHSLSPSPPPVSIRQTFNTTNRGDTLINVKPAVGVQGQDFFNRVHLQEENPGPSVTQLQTGGNVRPAPVPRKKPVSVTQSLPPDQKPIVSQVSAGNNKLDYTTLEWMDETPPKATPVTSNKPIIPQASAGNNKLDYTTLDWMDETPPKAIPVTSNKPIIPQASAGNNKMDYTTLEWMDDTPPKPIPVTSNKPNGIPVPKPRSQVPKSRFDYAEVLLEDSTVKDVDMALQLKANRPPPVPPTKYNPKSSHDQPPVPPNRQVSKKGMQPSLSEDNAQFPQQNSRPLSPPPAVSYNNTDDPAAPPPPPRRTGRISTERLPSPYPPVPPPR